MDKGVKDLIEEMTVKEPAKSNLLHVTYHLYNAQNKTNGFGDAAVRVSSRTITLEVINKIRDQLLQDFPEGSTIVIISWQRYDAEEGADEFSR